MGNTLYDIPVLDYKSADAMTKGNLKMRMWLARYNKYDSTTPYIKAKAQQGAENRDGT